MDPNANLQEQRRLSAEINTLIEQKDGEPSRREAERLIDLAGELADHAQALDEWISKGGFLPTAWRHKDTLANRV
jgi:hypothetical protein